MKEYMLRVLNRGDHQRNWPARRHTEFVKKCEVYIGKLKKAGKLIAAQPLQKQGLTVYREKKTGKQNRLKLLMKYRLVIITFAPRTCAKRQLSPKKTQNLNTARQPALKCAPLPQKRRARGLYICPGETGIPDLWSLRQNDGVTPLRWTVSRGSQTSTCGKIFNLAEIDESVFMRHNRARHEKDLSLFHAFTIRNQR